MKSSRSYGFVMTHKPYELMFQLLQDSHWILPMYQNQFDHIIEIRHFTFRFKTVHHFNSPNYVLFGLYRVFQCNYIINLVNSVFIRFTVLRIASQHYSIKIESLQKWLSAIVSLIFIKWLIFSLHVSVFFVLCEWIVCQYVCACCVSECGVCVLRPIGREMWTWRCHN